MGWYQGGEIMEALVISARKNMPVDPEAREKLYRDIIPVLLDNDADTLHDAKGHDAIYDRVIDELDPPEE